MSKGYHDQQRLLSIVTPAIKYAYAFGFLAVLVQ